MVASTNARARADETVVSRFEHERALAWQASVHTRRDSRPPAHMAAPAQHSETQRITAADTVIGLATFDDEQPGVEFIVEQFLPLDVALLVGPGGYGKSTLILLWAIGIILGLPIFGMRVLRPGPVVLVTAEDGTRRIRHRLHHMARQLTLTRDQVEAVAAQLHVLDLTARSARLAHLDRSGNIVGTALTEALIDAYRDVRPSAVFLDPLVSFGPGERHVNDGEQAVITQMRRIVDGLAAPVIGAHHTGKQVARDKIIDLYSGRGGSALGDGARAAFVMELVEGESVPHGLDPEDMAEKRLFRLHNVKLTDGPKWREPLWLVRHGLNFRDVAVKRPSAAAALEADAARLCALVKAQEVAGNKPDKKALEAAKGEAGLSRDRIRELVAWCLSSGLLVEVDLPKDQVKGQRKTYLHAVK